MVKGEELEAMWGDFQKPPHDNEKFRTLKESFLAKGDWQKLIELYSLYTKQIEKSDTAEAAKLYGEKASIEEKYLGQAQQALISYQKSYELQPEGNSYIGGFIQCCKGLGKWDQVCNIWEGQVVLSKSENEKLSILYQLIDCYLDKLKNKEKAKKLLQQIVAEYKSNEKAIEKLELLYLESEEYDELLKMYQVEIQNSTNTLLKIKRLHQMATICEQLKKEDHAIKVYLQILNIDIKDNHAYNALESIYNKNQNWSDLLQLMEKKLEVLSPQEQYKHLVLLAQMCNEKLKDSTKATRYLELALQFEENVEVLSLLAQKYNEQQKWDKLIEIYEKKISTLSEQKEIKAAYFDLIAVYEEKFDDASKAITYLYKALKVFPEDKEIIEKLKTLCDQEERKDDLIKIYELEIASCKNSQQKIAIYHKIGTVLTETNKISEAVKIYEKILGEESHNIENYNILEELYAELDNKEKRLQILVKKSQLLKGEQKIDTYQEIAQLCFQLRKEEEGVIYYQKIKQLQPQNLTVLYLLSDYYREKQDYPQLVSILQQIVNVDHSVYEHAYMEMAKIYEIHINNVDAAIKSYEKVIHSSPKNLEAYRNIRELYKKNNKHNEYVKLSTSLASLTPKISEKMEIFFALFEFYRERDLIANMEEQLLHVLELDTYNRKAITGLKELYTKKQDWKKLVVILEKEIHVLENMNMIMEQYKLIATYYQDKLRNIPEAIQCFERVSLLQPLDIKILQKLEVLYTQQENFEKLVKILQHKAYIVEEIPQRVNFMYMAAILWEEKLQNIDEAILGYEYVINHDSQNLHALERLKKLYKTKDVAKLEGIYQKLTKLITDKTKLVELYLEAVNFSDDKIANYEAIIELNPKNEAILDQLAEIYRNKENWNNLLRIYLKKLEATNDRNKVLDCHLNITNIYVQKLEAPTKAIEHYQKILSLDPKNESIVLELEKIHRNQQNWTELLSILNLKLRFSGTNKKEVLNEIGEIFVTKTFQYEEAIKIYTELHAMDETDRKILMALKSLYKAIEDYPKTLQILGKELECEKNSDKHSELLIEKAQIAQYYIDQPSVAAAAFEEVILKEPQNEEVFQKLFALYQKRGEHEKLLKLLIQQTEHASAENKIAFMMQQAYINEKHENWDRSIELYREILKVNDLEETKKALVGILRQQQKWDDLIHFYQAEFQTTKGVEKTVETYQAIGNIFLDQLGKYQEALEMYLQVLKLQPDNVQAIRAIGRIYVKQQNFSGLLEIYERELRQQNIENERVIWLHLACGEIYEHRQQNIEKAHEHYIKVLYNELDPNNLIAIRGLERIYQKEQKYNELQVMLLREFEVQKDPKRSLQLHLEIAQLKENYLEDFAGAIEYYRILHEAWPKDLFILNSLQKLLQQQEMWSPYIRVIEKKIALTHNKSSLLTLHEEAMRIYGNRLRDYDKAILHGKEVLVIDEKQLTTIQYLQKVYKKQEQEESMAEMFLKEAEISYKFAQTKHLCSLYLETGKIYLELHNYEKSISCFNEVLKLNPTESHAIKHLIKVYSFTEDWAELLRIYKWATQISQQLEDITNLHLKIARVWEDKLKDNLKALSHYQIAYSKNSNDLSIVKALRSIYEKMDKWPEAVEMLAKEVLLEEDDKKAKMYYRMGEIWEKKLFSLIHARDNYLKVLDFGFHRKTVQKLLKIQEEVHDYEGMIKILEENIRKCDPEERIPTMLKLGEIHWKCLHRADDAIRTYTKILKIDPQQPQTLTSMEEISTYKKDWRVLVGILNRQTRNTEDPQELYKLCVRIAGIFYEHLQEGNRAIDFYEKALSYEDNLEVAYKLEEIYEEWGYFHKSIALINKINEYEDVDKLKLAKKLGKIYADRVFDDTAAISTYQAILQQEEDMESYYALAQIYKRQYLWKDLIGIYKKLIEHTSNNDETEEQIKILLDAGKIYYHYLEDYDNSYQTLKKCLELAPLNDSAFLLLTEILENKQQYSDLANLFTSRINVSGKDEEKVELLDKLAEISLKHLENKENAIHYYEKILLIVPNNLKAIDGLEPLYMETKHFEALVHIYDLKLDAVKDNSIQADIYYKLARIYLEQFSDSVQAVAHLRMATEHYPNHVDSVKMLADILVQEENWTQAITNIEETIKNTNNPKEKFSLHMKLGNIYKNSLQDIQSAKLCFLKALDIDPIALEPLSAVIAIYIEGEQWKEADILLGTYVTNLPPENNEVVEAYYQWGIAAKKLQKLDDALARFKIVVEKNPDHLPSILNLAQIYFVKQSLKESLQFYDKAYKLESEATNINIIQQLALIHDELGNVDDAINYYQLLLDRNFSRLETLKALGFLYTKKNECERALLYQQQVLQLAPDGEEKALANKQMGEIYQLMGNSAKSIEYYLKAIEAGSESISLQQNLVALYIKDHNWERAKHYNDLCFSRLEDAHAKEENRNVQARILIGLKQNREAILCYQETLKLNNCCVKAIQGIAQIYITEGNWSALSIAYREFLQNLPEDKKIIGFPIHLALGYLYLEKLNNNKLARQQFEEVLEQDSDHTEALIALTKIKTQDPENQEEAIKGHFLILRKDPLRLDSYVDLHHLLKQIDKEERALKCHRAYEYLNGNKIEEPTKLRDLTCESVHTWIIPKPIQEIVEVMGMLEEYAEKIYPAKLEEDYAVKKREHLGAEQVQRPIWYHTHSIMKAMHISDLHMYVTPKFNSKIFLENTNPPSLIISQNLVNTLSESELRFLIAKHLFYVAQKQILTVKLDIHELNEYWRNSNLCFGTGVFESSELDAYQKKFRNLMPRKVKKILETKETFWKDFTNTDVKQYVKYMDYASNRCAFSLLDSIQTAIDSIYLWEAGKRLSAGSAVVDKIRDIDAINDILLYNISESYMQLIKC